MLHKKRTRHNIKLHELLIFVLAETFVVVDELQFKLLLNDLLLFNLIHFVLNHNPFPFDHFHIIGN